MITLESILDLKNGPMGLNDMSNQEFFFRLGSLIAIAETISHPAEISKNAPASIAFRYPIPPYGLFNPPMLYSRDDVPPCSEPWVRSMIDTLGMQAVSSNGNLSVSVQDLFEDNCAEVYGYDFLLGYIAPHTFMNHDVGNLFMCSVRGHENVLSRLVNRQIPGAHWYQSNESGSAHIFSVSGTAALDFVGKAYWYLQDTKNRYPKNSPISYFYKNAFAALAAQTPSLKAPVQDLSGAGPLLLPYNKTLEEAVPPFKKRPSDSGYDLTLIKKIDTETYPGYQVEVYDTGIAIKPPFGWSFDMVLRSSGYKEGYQLVQGAAIIDQGYRDSIKVKLIKIHPDVPDLQLPARIIQIVPRKIQHFEPTEVSDLGVSDRGTGGFGSSG